MGYNSPMENQNNPVVYVVTEDYGDGPRLVEIFSTRPLAEAFLCEYRADSPWASRGVEEWTVDEKAGHEQPLHTSSIVTLTPEGNAPVASSK